MLKGEGAPLFWGKGFLGSMAQMTAKGESLPPAEAMNVHELCPVLPRIRDDLEVS